MAENTSNIGFEKQIWDAACVLRGNMDASEYKSVVLGLIFLKYISDRFEAKYQELVDEGDGFEEDIDEYLAGQHFFAGYALARVVMVPYLFLRSMGPKNLAILCCAMTDYARLCCALFVRQKEGAGLAQGQSRSVCHALLSASSCANRSSMNSTASASFIRSE